MKNPIRIFQKRQKFTRNIQAENEVRKVKKNPFMNGHSTERVKSK